MEICVSCIICTMPRTGSWYLAEALQSTEVAGRPEEYLRLDWLWRQAWHGGLVPGHMLDYWPPARPMGLSRPSLSTEDIAKFLSEVRRIGTTGNGVFGVKLQLSQFEEFVSDARQADLADVHVDERTLRTWFPKPRYILLTRRDHLRQAISHCRAIKTDCWWVKGPGQQSRRPGAGSATESKDLADSDMAEIEQLRRLAITQEKRWRDILGAANTSMLEIHYEDLVDDPGSAVNAILRHLSLPEVTVIRKWSRLHSQADSVTEQTVHRYHKWLSAAALSTWPSAAEYTLPPLQVMTGHAHRNADGR